jgi:hypothetical protein
MPGLRLPPEYMTMEIDGPDATVTYYQYDADAGAETAVFTETL